MRSLKSALFSDFPFVSSLGRSAELNYIFNIPTKGKRDKKFRSWTFFKTHVLSYVRSGEIIHKDK